MNGSNNIPQSLLNAIVLVAAVVPSLYAQELHGTVVQKGTKVPLVSANILLLDTKYGTASDSLGKFTLKNFPPGVYVVEVRLVGFRTNRYILTAERDGPIVLSAELELDPILLREVLVSDSGKKKTLLPPGATIITSDEIVRSGIKTLSTFLRQRYPGLLPSNPAVGSPSRAYNNLQFVIYLNEALVLYTSDVLDTMIDIELVDYIEVYRSLGMTPTSTRGSNERIVHIHTKVPEFRR